MPCCLQDTVLRFAGVVVAADERLLAALHRSVTGFANVPFGALEVMPTTGLAHDHIIVHGTDWLLRVPRQSQMRLSAWDNLRYQVACFERMYDSGHTPRCHLVIEPTVDIPMGALLVDHIRGRALKAPSDMPLVATALAAIHALPLPATVHRGPLLNQQDPLAETFNEVCTQAQFLGLADLAPASLSRIRCELTLAERDVKTLPVSPVALVSFDAHPGNFVIDNNQRAYLVDLEKGRYGGAGFDLAHASLYTSTTWDRSSYAVMSAKEIQQFYTDWRNAMPAALAAHWQPYLMPMRRLMWLWSVTWCAKWQVQSSAALMSAKHTAENTEDWSADNTDAGLVAHIRERVSHYLAPDTIELVCRDWN